MKGSHLPLQNKRYMAIFKYKVDIWKEPILYSHEGGCYINHYYQENNTGLHLQGKVLEVDQDRFRIHLDKESKSKATKPFK